MHFGNPIALWAFAFFPVLVLLAWLAHRRRRSAMARAGDPALVIRLSDPSVSIWRRRRTLASLAIFLLLAFSAARPQYGRVEQTIKRSGIDLIVAIDTSPSMLATDVKPSRIEAAKEALKRLLGRMRGNRVGIVAFAGDAFLLCPMTLDGSLASLVLDSVGSDTISAAGTDIGRAIEVAQGAFERGGSGSPILVLITDGEDNEGRGLAAAKKAAVTGTRIFAIGIGTDRGAPVPDSKSGYKETAQGSKVVSRLDMAGLKAIADAGGGEAFSAEDKPGPAVSAISARLDRLEKGEIEGKKLVIYQDRFAWFVAPALVLLLWVLLARPGQPRALLFEEGKS